MAYDTRFQKITQGRMMKEVLPASVHPVKQSVFKGKTITFMVI
jgi:hypothetical protein